MIEPYILPYKAGSAGARALADSLNCKRLRLMGSKFKHKPDRLVINWGNNNRHVVRNLVKEEYPNLNCQILDDGELAIKHATNKLSFFNCMNEVMPESIPEYATHLEVAWQWCQEGAVVVCRTLLNSSAGKGIVIANTPKDVVKAPLYVKYIKKQDEYRVHVFNGKVIDVQRKMRKKDVPDEEVNWQVRNHANGFIFGRDDVFAGDNLTNLCTSCINILSLDFGAVDVIYNKHEDKYYLLEVNTAPGLVGTTLEKYTQAIKDYCN